MAASARSVFLYVVCLQKLAPAMRNSYDHLFQIQHHDHQKADPFKLTEDLEYHHYNAMSSDGHPTALLLAISKNKLRISVSPQHAWGPVLKDDKIEWKLVDLRGDKEVIERYLHGDEKLIERKDYDFTSGEYYLQRVQGSGNASENAISIGLVYGQPLDTVSAMRYIPEDATLFALQYLQSMVKYKIYKGSQGWAPKETVCTDLNHAKQHCAGEDWCKGFSYDSESVTGYGEHTRACFKFVDEFEIRTDEKYSANTISLEKILIDPKESEIPAVGDLGGWVALGFPVGFFGTAMLGSLMPAASGGLIALTFFGPIVGLPFGVAATHQIKHRISNFFKTKVIPARLKNGLRKYLPTLMNDGSKHLYKFAKKHPIVKTCSDKVLVKDGSTCPSIPQQRRFVGADPGAAKVANGAAFFDGI